MAEIALGVAGAVIGPAAGVTSLTGFQIGVTLGSLLFPPAGPRLDRGRVDEIRIQGASQGNPIPIVYGRNRVAGTIIWATGLIETSTTTGGGKGGGGARVTEYSYTTSLAIVICEGPLTKIRRIFANEDVIYDWRTGGSPTLAGFLDPSKVRVYLGGQTTADAAIEADKGAGNVPAFKGLAYVVFEDLPLGEFGNNVPNFTFEVESATVDLEAALEDLAGRVGLGSGDYDFSDLAGYPTRGLVVSARTEAARVMETFARANLFEIVETGGKIKGVLRDGVPVLTIPAEDIGASADDGDVVPFVETVRSEETELPREYVVSYQSEAIDFLQWTQTARRTTRWSENQEQVNFPMGLSDAYARFLADAFLMEAWTSRSRHAFSLPYRYARLDPGDVVRIPDEAGGLRSVRIKEMNMGLLAQIEVIAVDDDPVIYVDPGLPASVPTGGGTGISSSDIADLLVLEGNAAYDEYADSPQLACAAGRASPGWRGGYAETDPAIPKDGGSYRARIADFSASATFGYTTADPTGVLGLAVPAGRTIYDLPTVLDTINTVRVTFTNGSPSSVTYDEMVTEGRNLIALGKEILQFQTATFIGGSTYELSNLLRFRRGTDYLLTEYDLGNWAGHAQGDPFLLFDSRIKNFDYDPSAIGSTHDFRLIETGVDYSSGLPAFGEPITLAGDARKPYGPVDLRYSGDRSSGTADVSLSWVRRVRTKGEMVDFAEAPLDEIVEAYTVEIWDAAFTGLISSYESVGSGAFVYSVAAQTTDGVQASAFGFIVRQKSPEPGIGNGHRSAPKVVNLTEDIDY